MAQYGLLADKAVIATAIALIAPVIAIAEVKGAAHLKKRGSIETVFEEQAE